MILTYLSISESLSYINSNTMVVNYIRIEDDNNYRHNFIEAVEMAKEIIKRHKDWLVKIQLVKDNKDNKDTIDSYDAFYVQCDENGESYFKDFYYSENIRKLL